MRQVPPQNRWQPSRLYSPAVLEWWWVRVPAVLRRYSALLSTAWADGIYLTAWPRSAMLLSVVSAVLGVIAGASHWSPLTIDATGAPSPPAIVFAQMLPLLAIAVAVGSVSANAGTMLVLGYVVADFLIAGPQLQAQRSAPLSQFLYLRLPQLISYMFFFMLAAAPTLVTKSLLAGLNQRIKGPDFPSTIVRTGAAAVVQAGLVYGWTLGAVMVIRIFWAWVDQYPPLSERYYLQATDPWLPLIAAAAVLARGGLAFKAEKRGTLETLDKNLYPRGGLGQHHVFSRSPLWLRLALKALLMTLFTAGFIDSLFLGAAVLLVFFGILAGRTPLLPRLRTWQRWAGLVGRLPLLFRLIAVIVGGYLFTRLVLALPGQSAAQNGVPGKFGPEIVSIVLGLLVAVALIPQYPGMTAAKAGSAGGTAGLRGGRGTQIVVLFTFLLMASGSAYADICLDPRCCFGSDELAALAVIGLLLFLAIAIAWEMFAAAAAVDAAVAAVASAGEAAQAAAAASTAAAADAAAAQAIAGSIAGGDMLAAQAAAEAAAEAAAATAQAAEQAGQLAVQASTTLQAGNVAEASQLAQQAIQAGQAAQTAAETAARELSDLLGSLPPDQAGPAITQVLEGALQNQGLDAATQIAENIGAADNGPAALQAALNNIGAAGEPVSGVAGSGGGVRTLQILQGIIRRVLGL